MDNNREYIQILIDTLRNKEQVLKDILAVTKEQEILATVDTFSEDKFDETLDKKEKLIAKINELDFGFDASYNKVKSYLISNKSNLSSEISMMQEFIKKCTDISMELKVLETRNSEKFKQVFSVKKNEYKQVKATQSAATNYYKTMSNTQVVDSYFFNQKQ